MSWCWKIWDDNNLLDTLKKHSQFQKCGIIKVWKFKLRIFENLEFQNFKNSFTTYKWGIM
jgi:hypothetical protein